MGRSLTGAAIKVLRPMPDSASALALARSLLEALLAACVSVGATVGSLYHWRGQIETTRNYAKLRETTLCETAQEIPVAVKTHADR